jgi:predicted nucleic acid-binding protein
MIVDTDVLIWASRGNQKAVRSLERNRGFRISAVTYAEVVQGARNSDEVRGFQKGLRLWGSTVLHINEFISQHAIFLIERFALSHSLCLADALVAATATHYGEVLLTGNTGHYRMVPELELQAFKP